MTNTQHCKTSLGLLILCLVTGCIQVPTPSSSSKDMSPRDMSSDISIDQQEMSDMPEMGCVFDMATTCAANNYVCGTLNVPDSCGQFRELSCGTCLYPDACFNGKCVDTCLNDAQLCNKQVYECGMLSTTDMCQQSRVIDCGGCAEGLTCAEQTDLSSICVGCTAPTCAVEQCGWATNTCGATACAKQCAPGSTCVNGNECLTRIVTVSSLRGSSRFGQTIALDTLTLAVGAPEDDPMGLSPRRGTVFMYERGSMQSPWRRAAKIHPPDNQSVQNFGRALVVSQDTVVIGAPLWDSSSQVNQGVAYVYQKNNNAEWVLTSTLEAKEKRAQGRFGSSLCMTNNNIFVGAPSSTSLPGRVHVFERNSPHEHKYMIQGPGAGTLFGTQLACTDNHVAIADKQTAAGEVFVYERSAEDKWDIKVRLTPSDMGTTRNFGHAVAMKGDEVIISAFQPGAPLELYNITTGIQTTIPPDDSLKTSVLGDSLAMGEDTIFASPRRLNRGVEIYRRVNDQWVRDDSPLGKDSADLNSSQLVLASSGSNIAVGAPFHLSRGYYPGEALTYQFDTVTQKFDVPQRITPPEVHSGSYFGGGAMTMDGDQLIIASQYAFFGNGQVHILSKSPMADAMTDPTRLWMDDQILGTNELPIGLGYGGGFGQSILVNEKHLLISASGNVNAATRRPAQVYAYTRSTPGEAWRYAQIIEASYFEETLLMGQSMVWMSDTTFALSAPTLTDKPGQVRIYRFTPAKRWEIVQIIEGPANAPRFGDSMVYNAPDDMLLVGNPTDSNGTVSIYIKQANRFTYSLLQTVEPPDPNGPIDHREFGYDLAVNGGWVAISDPVGRLKTGAINDGVIHMYRRQPDGTIRYKETLTDLPANARSRFGHSIAMREQTLFVGAPERANTALQQQLAGAVDVFQIQGNNNWLLSRTQLADAPVANSRYGWSIEVTPSHLMVGMPSNGYNGLRAGQVYLYDRVAP